MSSHYAALAVVLEDLPVLVRERRLARGVSLRELARRVGIHHATLWRFERDETDLRTRNQIELLLWLDDTNLTGDRS